MALAVKLVQFCIWSCLFYFCSMVTQVWELMSCLVHLRIQIYRQEVCTELTKLEFCTEFSFRGELKLFLNIVVRFIVRLIQVTSIYFLFCKSFLLLFILGSDRFKRFLKIFVEWISYPSDLKRKRL